MEKRKSKRGLYSVAVGLLIALFFQGLLSHQQALLVEPASVGLGMTRAQFSALDAFTQGTNLVLSVFYAKTLGRVGLKKMMCIGAFGPFIYCVTIYLAAMYRQWAAPLVAIGEAALGLMLSWTSIVSVSVLIENWFAKKRGLIISIIQAVAGLGGTVFSPIVAGWIMDYGWELSLVFRGVICFAAAVVMCFLIRVKPDKGEDRIWEEQADDSELIQVQTAGTGVTIGQARRTSQFWLTLLFFFFVGLFVHSPALCIAAHVSDMGFPELSGTVLSVIYGTSLVCTLPFGSLLEKFKCRRILGPMLILMSISMVLLSIRETSAAMLYIAAMLIGVNWSMITVPLPLMTKEVFGDRDFAAIQSYFYASLIGGMIVGGPVFNLGYDIFGSYNLFYAITAGLLIGMIVVLFLATRKIRLKEDMAV